MFLAAIKVFFCCNNLPHRIYIRLRFLFSSFSLFSLFFLARETKVSGSFLCSLVFRTCERCKIESLAKFEIFFCCHECASFGSEGLILFWFLFCVLFVCLFVSVSVFQRSRLSPIDYMLFFISSLLPDSCSFL